MKIGERMQNNLEFFMNNKGNQLVVNDLSKDQYFPFDENAKELVMWLDNKIEDDHPEALERCLEVTNPTGTKTFENRFSAVDRFCRCNFHENDNKADVDDDGNLVLEHVSCPLRGICPDETVICKPKLNTKLSKRELEVAKELASGNSIPEICKTLFISEDTVKNHRAKIYKKLGFNKIAELMTWAYKNKIVE